VFGFHISWLASVFVRVTTAFVPTVLLNNIYLVPAEVAFAVVIVFAVLAVPVRLAVTVVHVKVPPVFVRASVLGLYVKALACVLREDAAVPDVAFVKRSRNATALIVLLIVIVEPEPDEPWGIVMSKIAAVLVPELVTIAEDPGAPVVTVPTAMVAGPLGPVGPSAPSNNTHDNFIFV
jgi:hypothetical protein